MYKMYGIFLSKYKKRDEMGLFSKKNKNCIQKCPPQKHNKTYKAVTFAQKAVIFTNPTYFFKAFFSHIAENKGKSRFGIEKSLHFS